MYLSLKSGASLSFNLAFTDDLGAPLDLSAATVAIQIRDDDGNLFGEATVAPGTGTGAATASVDASVTATWPPGILRMDVMLVIGGQTLISDTASIQVAAAVTQL